MASRQTVGVTSHGAVSVAYKCCLVLDSVASFSTTWLWAFSQYGLLSVSGASYLCSVLSNNMAFCQTMRPPVRQCGLLAVSVVCQAVCRSVSECDLLSDSVALCKSVWPLV